MRRSGSARMRVAIPLLIKSKFAKFSLTLSLQSVVAGEGMAPNAVVEKK